MDAALTLTASRCAILVVSKHKLKERASMEEVSIIGVDLAKNVFQLHGAAADGAVVFRKKLSRLQFARFMADHPACEVAMAACPSAHHWARELSAYERRSGTRSGAGRAAAGSGGTPARDRGRDGHQTQRTDGSRAGQRRQSFTFSTSVTPGSPAKCASHVRSCAPCACAVANMIASAVARLWVRQASAAASAIVVSSTAT